MIDFIKEYIPLWIVPQLFYIIGFLVLVLSVRRWILTKK